MARRDATGVRSGARLPVGSVGYLRAAVHSVALMTTVTFGVLAVLGTAPALLGWTPAVVRTGSMEPSLRPGDLVLYEPVPASRLVPGNIVLAADPNRPGELLSHRLFMVDGGVLRTKGDANLTADSAPIDPSTVRGRGRLVIPFVGRPMAAVSSGERTVWAAAGLLLIVLAAQRPGGTVRVGRHRRGRRAVASDVA